ncbi:hypothetical protein [Carnobacterium funditum]|uniref:hypothetical protein n=1 Tax=Carnobacterium funditum TaxID=2752 RepID=UPI0005514B80|nr:hypothetical protein [Carnobacterium funditum]
MELFALLSFLSFLIPLLLIVTVIRSISNALFNQKNGKNGAVSKYQEFMKEINQEKDRLRNVPDKKDVSRNDPKAANLAQQRNNLSQSAKHAPYQQSPVRTKREPLAERNRIQPVTKSAAISRSYSDMPSPVKNFVQTKKQVNKKIKQTPRQKEIIKGFIYKEILDKPRAMNPYR